MEILLNNFLNFANILLETKIIGNITLYNIIYFIIIVNLLHNIFKIIKGGKNSE